MGLMVESLDRGRPRGGHLAEPPGDTPDKRPEEWDERRKKDLEEGRGLTTRLGRLAEQMVMPIWGGELKVDSVDLEQLRLAYRDTYDGLARVRQHTMPHWGQASVWREVLNPEGGWIEDVRCEDNSLLMVFSEVDRLTGSKLFSEAASRLGYRTREMIPASIRYLGEGAMVLARELLNPSLRFNDGRLIPNVLWVNGHGTVAQFDAVVLGDTPSDAMSGNSMGEILERNLPYGVVEVKTVFGAEFTSGGRKLGSVRLPHRREFQRRLGLGMVEVHPKLYAENCYQPDGDYNVNLFPAMLMMVYLRGSQNNVIHRMGLDANFWRSWQVAIEDRLIMAGWDGNPVNKESLLAGLNIRESDGEGSDGVNGGEAEDSSKEREMGEMIALWTFLDRHVKEVRKMETQRREADRSRARQVVKRLKGDMSGPGQIEQSYLLGVEMGDG